MLAMKMSTPALHKNGNVEVSIPLLKIPHYHGDVNTSSENIDASIGDVNASSEDINTNS
jgi:hypothetical protein